MIMNETFLQFENAPEQDKAPENGGVVQRQVENRESFLSRFNDWPLEQVQMAEFAYDLAKAAHRTQKRDSGERYFEHLRSVALILTDELKLRKPSLIKASLLHDSIEDTPLFGNSSQGYSKWKNTSLFRISKVFDTDVANIVVLLTKPKVDGVEIKNKKEAESVYLEGLAKASPDVILLKMCDRLHNLRTLVNNTPEKRKRIVVETEQKYFPIFKKILQEYPQEGNYLLEQMKSSIEQLKKID